MLVSTTVDSLLEPCRPALCLPWPIGFSAKFHQCPVAGSSKRPLGGQRLRHLLHSNIVRSQPWRKSPADWLTRAQTSRSTSLRKRVFPKPGELRNRPFVKRCCCWKHITSQWGRRRGLDWASGVGRETYDAAAARLLGVRDPEMGLAAERQCANP
jgi:hypothetical protein